MAIVKLLFPQEPTAPMQYNAQNKHLAVVASNGYNSPILKVVEGSLPVIKQGAVIRHNKEVYIVENESYAIETTDSSEGYLIVRVVNDSIAIKWSMYNEGFMYDTEKNGFYDSLDNQLLRDYSFLSSDGYILNRIYGNLINQKITKGSLSFNTKAQYRTSFSNVLSLRTAIPGFEIEYDGSEYHPNRTYLSMSNDGTNILLLYTLRSITTGYNFVQVISIDDYSEVSVIEVSQYVRHIAFDAGNLITLLYSTVDHISHIEVHDGLTSTVSSTFILPTPEVSPPYGIEVYDGNLVVLHQNSSLSSYSEIRVYNGISSEISNSFELSYALNLFYNVTYNPERLNFPSLTIDRLTGDLIISEFSLGTNAISTFKDRFILTHRMQGLSNIEIDRSSLLVCSHNANVLALTYLDYGVYRIFSEYAGTTYDMNENYKLYKIGSMPILL